MPLKSIVCLVVFLAGLPGQLPAQSAGQDLRLTYRSLIDDSDQPYRLYVPTAYDGAKLLPLIVAMHGTSGNEATLFDDKAYQPGAIKPAAEKHGVLLASPLGRGTTEYRGIGEHDVLCVLDDIQKNYKVDPDRVYLTGHSMGGTGAAYLALHHPDQFAAVAPLAAAYSFPWLARNATTIPFLWVGGATDAGFYHRGVAVGVERMRKFGVPVLSEAIPDVGHQGPVQDFDRIFAWLLKHQRNRHPDTYFFEVDTALHGRAFWTSIERIEVPGRMASIALKSRTADAVELEVVNVAEFTFIPDPDVFALNRGIHVTINGTLGFAEPIPSGQQLRIRRISETGWGCVLEMQPRTDKRGYRDHPVATAPELLDMTGTEKRLANWITDAMRAATGADVALYNPVYYRGLPIPQGQVDIVDLVQCSRPFDQYLVTARLTGREIIEILDRNADPKQEVRAGIDTPGSGRLVQLSGARYTFDPDRAAGMRIVATDLVPYRVYTVVMEGQAVERETLLLAGRFEKLDYQTTDVPFTLAMYGHAARSGRIEAKVEGRILRAQSGGTP
ncbi:MAG: 5'-nucleotidase C-terminal domain-containing protein [Planctomycetales bacterium]